MLAVPFDKISGSTRLFLDFIRCSGSACEFYKYDFRDLSSYKSAAAAIDSFQFERDELVSVIREGLKTIGIPERVEENLRKLSGPDSLVVFAGQQVGVLLGPMYTVIKALTSYKLAAKLEGELGRPVVPCFWMATDDHDFDEIKTAKLLDRAGDCIPVSYEPRQLGDSTPASDIILDEKIMEFLAGIKGGLVETEFTSSIDGLVEKSYAEGMTLSKSFASLFNSFLGDFGIIPVDPNFPGMKNLMSPVFRNEIEHHREIFGLFEDRSQAIIAAGYHRQVHKTADNLNLFMKHNGRRNIIVQDGTFVLDGEDKKFTESELMSFLDKDAGDFSPNVCLRPVAQCAALPTVCQITGPSEAAYFAQIQPIFEFMKIPFPVVRPRMFATLMEPQIARNVRKLSIDFLSLYNDMEKEIGRVIEMNFPPEIRDRAESIRAEIEKPLDKLANSLKGREPEGYQAIEHTRKRVDHELNHLSKKLLAIHKKKHDSVREQIYRVANFLFPEGRFQERVVSPVYYADKFGPDVFRKIEENLDIDSVDHQVVEL